MTQPDLSVVIFAFNEEANIAPVLTELREWLAAHEPSAEVIFVDDGSADATSDEAAKALAGMPYQLLRHEGNRGIGAALKTGVRAARGAWITFLPADGQIAPGAIGTLRAAASREHAEVVFSVYDHRDDGLHRKVLSAGVRALIWLIHGVRMRSDGPYLFRRPHFDPDQLVPDTFFLNFEFPIRVLGAAVPATVVTIECRPRRSGHSKSTGLKRIYGVAQDLLELRVRRAKEAHRRPA
jgi:dolichol-phosphate mannosyltransferase